MKRSVLITHMLTPQAAPETAALKRLRIAWMVLCCLLALGAIGIRLWFALFGLAAPAVIFLLLLLTLLVGAVYFTRKVRADDQWAMREETP
ncbi:MAG: hypothetical protein WA793_12125 [Sphingorhabdus sp.]|uniref:hypothetical protein n=1 Tax=Sphingorhabdus sp. TaxID=1902408 RepID=UPI003CAA172A